MIRTVALPATILTRATIRRGTCPPAIGDRLPVFRDRFPPFENYLNRPPLLPSAFKIAQKKPALVSPASSSRYPLRSPVALQGPSSSSCTFSNQKLKTLKGLSSLSRLIPRSSAGLGEGHRPIDERLHRWTQRFPKLGEFIFHLWGELRMNCSLHQLALLKKTQLLRQLRCEMPGTARSSSENRQIGRAKSLFRITIFHLPSRIESAASTLLAL
jgi:hypothetical protein